MVQETAVVPVKSSWLSKINWTQIAGAAVTLLTTNAFGLDDATQVKVLAGVQIAQSAATIVLRTWYNGTVSPASLSK